MLIELGKPNKKYIVLVPRQISDTCISFISKKFRDLAVSVVGCTKESVVPDLDKGRFVLIFGNFDSVDDRKKKIAGSNNWISYVHEESVGKWLKEAINISVNDFFTAKYRKYEPAKKLHIFRIEGTLKLEIPATEDPITVINKKLEEIKMDPSFIMLDVNSWEYEELSPYDFS